MLYTITTAKNIDEVELLLQKNAQEVGFGILKEYEFKDILKSKGYPIQRDVRVFEVCNPVAAQSALKEHPEISVYLPCRISIYEVNDETVVSTIGLNDILASFDMDKKFKEDMQSIFDNLKKLISSLK